MNNQSLLQTARNLRKSVGVTACMLPLLLLWMAGPQDSISATYYTAGRDALVGALALVSGFMWGFASADWRSRYAARVAAISAAVVAACPTAPANPVGWDQWIGVAHGFAALLFFGSLAYQCWQLFSVGATDAMRTFYRACACVIVAGIVISAAGILVGAPGRYVFWAEAISIWAFGASWFLVARETKV